MKRLPALLFLIIICTRLCAQINVKDSLISFPMIGVNFAYQEPGGDMAKRFGNNLNIGALFNWKLRSNWIFGLEGNFIFSDKVKENHILDSISTHLGYVINANGEYADVLIYERGLKIDLKVGKIFPIIGPNKNSGLMITLAGGILQHKIRIVDVDNNVPSISGDYAKGYDRLTNGFSLTEFVGYINFSSSRLINFFAGFEFTQGFTQNRRSFNFDTREQDTQKRKDLLSGIRVGWVFPLYKRLPRQFYYN